MVIHCMSPGRWPWENSLLISASGQLDSEPHRELTFAGEEIFQPLEDGCLYEQVDELILLLQLLVRVTLCDVRVLVVVFVDFVDHHLVDRPIQECSVHHFYKSATGDVRVSVTLFKPRPQLLFSHPRTHLGNIPFQMSFAPIIPMEHCSKEARIT